MTNHEKRYGRNEWINLELCPRCVCAVPCRVEELKEGVNLYCKKCEYHGHKDGSFIKFVSIHIGVDTCSRCGGKADHYRC